LRSYPNRQDLGRPWRVWDLDAEMRYWPVLEALPPDCDTVCEIGSGAAGLSTWTEATVIGVDPGSDDRHGDFRALPNLRRVLGSGSAIPLSDRSVSATVAVDTFEHIPPDERQQVVDEMIRVTRPGGRVVIIGPIGPEAAAGDRWLFDRLSNPGPAPDWSQWLVEHFEMGVPTVGEIAQLLARPRVERVISAGYLNVHLWRMMHSVAMKPRHHLGRLHGPVWGTFALIARRYRRGPFYRQMFVAYLS
jgi:SAM-dependent methyltransferase